jgi:hypothetical protein
MQIYIGWSVAFLGGYWRRGILETVVLHETCTYNPHWQIKSKTEEN